MDGLEPARDFMNIDLKLWTLISQAKDALYRVRKKEISEYGISMSQAGVLVILGFQGGSSTPVKISRWMLRTQNSVFQVLANMERDGLITRSKDLSRKNLVRITLTEQGKQVYQRLTERTDSIQRMLSSLSAAERKRLRSYLLTLRDTAFQELREKAPPWPKSP
jgi:MarR family 2-MHQ and catechol resistance regulon transcriptional repressor